MKRSHQNGLSQCDRPRFCECTEQDRRRHQWYALVRARIGEVFEPDGTARLPQFAAPYREPIWILPALYRGAREHIALANRVLVRYHAGHAVAYRTFGKRKGREYNVFQSNAMACLLHDYRDRMTAEAVATSEWHARQVFKTYAGSAQPDYAFQGANDNMPAMATCGLILGGQALQNEAAVAHGKWNLRRAAALLSRNAWMSEYNSSTYSPITLVAFAKIAASARDPEIAALARDLESRLWAEVLLHYHPGTLRQAGPMSRAAPIDLAGHNHTLQMLYWYAFGSELAGRNLPRSYFGSVSKEIFHFSGCRWCSIAEYTHLIDTPLHVTDHMLRLLISRRYPALLRGTSEHMLSCGMPAEIHTETYMEDEFSIGSSDRPYCGGEHSAPVYATYKLRPRVRSFRDAASLFAVYVAGSVDVNARVRSEDGCSSSGTVPNNQGWMTCVQQRNTVAMLCTPNVDVAPLDTDSLKLLIFFCTHHGRSRAHIVGTGKPSRRWSGRTATVSPISVDVGEVFIHVRPLIPTKGERGAAVRLVQGDDYEAIELINFEAKKRRFNRRDLSRVLNGMVLTVSPRRQYGSIERFHREHSDARIIDYYFAMRRCFEYQRGDCRLGLTIGTDPFGIQNASVDGRKRPSAVCYSTEMDVDTLPFMFGPAQDSMDPLPWETMDLEWYENSWAVGSHGMEGEPPYSKPRCRMRNHRDRLRPSKRRG